MTDLVTPFWYERPGQVDHWFCGVFEGGGAKGIAYQGALQAMKDNKCWFRSVAGASAGAVTAALIAAGMDPPDIEELTDKALLGIRTRPFGGLRRLRKETGYFDAEVLRNLLDDVFRSQVASSESISPITFEQLHTSGIELNIVAADLSAHRQFVFNHRITPACSVAEAVVASSAIPFAFPSRLLRVPDDGHGTFHHTIVDGGVWSNFPWFVYSDPDFRAMYGYPKLAGPDRIVGFVLATQPTSSETDPPILSSAAMPSPAESSSLTSGVERHPTGSDVSGDHAVNENVPRGPDITFVPPATNPISALEWHAHSKATGSGGIPARIAGWLLWPFAILGRLLAFNEGTGRGRWPQPASSTARRLVDSLDGLLAGVATPLLGLFALFAVVIGAWTGVASLVDDGSWTNAWTLVGVALLGAVAALLVLAALLGILANYLLLHAVRRVGYGIVRTYVAGPGAPPWLQLRPDVISLPIPEGLTTLTFDPESDIRDKAITDAYTATTIALRRLPGPPQQRGA